MVAALPQRNGSYKLHLDRKLTRRKPIDTDQDLGCVPESQVHIAVLVTGDNVISTKTTTYSRWFHNVYTETPTTARPSGLGDLGPLGQGSHQPGQKALRSELSPSVDELDKILFGQFQQTHSRRWRFRRHRQMLFPKSPPTIPPVIPPVAAADPLPDGKYGSRACAKSATGMDCNQTSPGPVSATR